MSNHQTVTGHDPGDACGCPACQPGNRYRVIDLATGDCRGEFDTLEEAEGCALYGPRAWQIWQGETLIDHHDPDVLVTVDRMARIQRLTKRMIAIIELHRFRAAALERRR